MEEIQNGRTVSQQNSEETFQNDQAVRGEAEQLRVERGGFCNAVSTHCDADREGAKQPFIPRVLSPLQRDGTAEGTLCAANERVARYEADCAADDLEGQWV